jgi:hypothetical protein
VFASATAAALLIRLACAVELIALEGNILFAPEPLTTPTALLAYYWCE